MNIHHKTHRSTIVAALLILCSITFGNPAIADEVVPVNVDNFVRAESDHMFRANMKAFQVSIGKFTHLREPTTAENQPVIRMNQDTLYSGSLLDLSKPVTITLPEVGGRYMSMHVISQDHFCFVEAKPGTYTLTEDNVGTRFAFVSMRTFYDAADSKDLVKAHAAQDKIEISGGGEGPFEAPNWDTEQLAVARKALNDLAVLGFDATYSFGSKEEVRPIDHLVGAAAGWGGLPVTAAMYILDSVENNDGETRRSMPSGPSRSTTPTGISKPTTSAATASTAYQPSRTRTAPARSVLAAIPRARTTCPSPRAGTMPSACTSRARRSSKGNGLSRV